ncbi:hypothetical protein DVH24_023269 [Malus domestica]|uniref:chorismate synthase n=1 Tax=Malus domestica TaxID=3750 RepID=A0A498KTS7_MALDO|nr:hypothetical protein DVH24_023269 [Malus domestica]
MASSLVSTPFIGAPTTNALSGLRTTSSSVQFVMRPRTAKKIQVQAAGNITGNHFRVTTFGEAHGGGVGQSPITTLRKETDTCRILSGVHEGVTTGTPILVLVPNTDQKGRVYDEMSVAYRPLHADRTYDQKYGIRSVQGGGRSSARETIGRVAAGALAKKILKAFSGTEVLGYVSQVQKVVLPKELVDHHTLTLDQIESNIFRCPDPEYAEKMIAAVDAVRVKGDSVGGIVTCIVRNCPPGLGSPVFDKLEAELAKAAMSIPATKGFEIGSGFAGTFLTVSEHNDDFYLDDQGKIRTRTNRSGGIQGGLSNGEIINMRIALKPTATIGKKQNTVTRDKREIELRALDCFDPCVVPRAVPIVEAAIALALVDQLMADFAQCHMFPINPDLQDPVRQPLVEAMKVDQLSIYKYFCHFALPYIEIIRMVIFMGLLDISIIRMVSKLVLVLLLFHDVVVAKSSSTLQKQYPSCPDEERSALLRFKDSFIIDKSASRFADAYPKVSSWKPAEGENSTCCSWEGVNCDEKTGHVIGLDLGSSCLHGSINTNSSLFRLVHLQRLNLSDNNFNYSQTPTSIRKFPKPFSS